MNEISFYMVSNIFCVTDRQTEGKSRASYRGARAHLNSGIDANPSMCSGTLRLRNHPFGASNIIDLN